MNSESDSAIESSSNLDSIGSGVTGAIGKIILAALLWLSFFIIITPIGLLKRLSGKDRMARHFDASVASYRVPSTQHPKRNLHDPY